MLIGCWLYCFVILIPKQVWWPSTMCSHQALCSARCSQWPSVRRMRSRSLWMLPAGPVSLRSPRSRLERGLRTRMRPRRPLCARSCSQYAASMRTRPLSLDWCSILPTAIQSFAHAVRALNKMACAYSVTEPVLRRLVILYVQSLFRGSTNYCMFIPSNHFFR